VRLALRVEHHHAVEILRLSFLCAVEPAAAELGRFRRERTLIGRFEDGGCDIEVTDSAGRI
jgi:hypothetical protein